MAGAPRGPRRARGGPARPAGASASVHRAGPAARGGDRPAARERGGGGEGRVRPRRDHDRAEALGSTAPDGLHDPAIWGSRCPSRRPRRSTGTSASAPATLGPPDRVWVDAPEDQPVGAAPTRIVMAWRPTEDLPAIPGSPFGAVLIRWDGHVAAGVKLVGTQDFRSVEVQGWPEAFWVRGPHELVLSTPDGPLHLVVRGHVLLWGDETTTFRLESQLTMRAAIAPRRDRRLREPVRLRRCTPGIDPRGARNAAPTQDLRPRHHGRHDGRRARVRRRARHRGRRLPLGSDRGHGHHRRSWRAPASPRASSTSTPAPPSGSRTTTRSSTTSTGRAGRSASSRPVTPGARPSPTRASTRSSARSTPA